MSATRTESYAYAIGLCGMSPVFCGTTTDEDPPSQEVRSFASAFCNRSHYETYLPGQFMFDNLMKAWHKERGATSSITKMAMCPSYQKIIAMGPLAIPLILRQLRKEGENPDMWFWALRMLTSADPVTDDMRGDVVKMANAWLNWGSDTACLVVGLLTNCPICLRRHAPSPAPRHHGIIALRGQPDAPVNAGGQIRMA